MDIAVVFQGGGSVMFTIGTYDNIAADAVDPERTLDERCYADLLVVKRIDPANIHHAVSCVVATGLLRCGIWVDYNVEDRFASFAE